MEFIHFLKFVLPNKTKFNLIFFLINILLKIVASLVNTYLKSCNINRCLKKITARKRKKIKIITIIIILMIINVHYIKLSCGSVN